jgi:hypothetical protein
VGKRDMIIYDDSGDGITLTLWREDAQREGLQVDSLLLLKDVRINEF